MGCRCAQVGQPREVRKNDSVDQLRTRLPACLGMIFCRPYRGLALRGSLTRGSRRGLQLYRPDRG